MLYYFSQQVKWEREKSFFYWPQYTDFAQAYTHTDLSHIESLRAIFTHSCDDEVGNETITQNYTSKLHLSMLRALGSIVTFL